MPIRSNDAYTVRSPNDEFRPCKGMTQDERLPGPEIILSIQAAFSHQKCRKVWMEVNFFGRLIFLGLENCSVTHVPLQTILMLFSLPSEIFPTVSDLPTAILRSIPCLQIVFSSLPTDNIQSTHCTLLFLTNRNYTASSKKKK